MSINKKTADIVPKEKEIDSLTSIENNIAKIVSYEKKDISRESDLGKMDNFLNVKPDFQRAILLVKKLSSLNLNNLPTSALEIITHELSNLTFVLNELFKYSTNMENHLEEKRRIIDGMESSVNSLYHNVGKYFNIGSTEYDHINTLNQYIVDKKKEIDTTIRKANDILDLARDESSIKSIAKHKQLFEKQALEFKKSAKKWFSGLVALSVALIGVVIGAVFLPYEAMSSQQTLQAFIAKILIFSNLYFLILWCGKNYNNQKHNVIINTQRQNALNTFDLFLNSAHSSEVKDILLTQVSTAIFSPQPTGYIKHGENEQSVNITEIIKNLPMK